MALAKKLKNFAQAGAQGVKRASESENKPSHYIPGSYDGYERVVKNRMFNPIHTGDSSWTPTTSSSSSSSANNYNYPSAETSQPFNSKWSDELNAMYEQIKNKPKFSYDQSKDPLYQQYAAMYQKNAQLAMNDTMARASALTGGYGNSYAQTAGQQMYNQQMDQLNDKALDLYYAALDKYNAENDDLYKQFNLAGQMYGYDYNAWRDQMADSRWAQEFNYGAYRDSISDRRYDDETAYNRGIDARNYNYQLSRDAVSDARYNQEFQYQMARDAESDRRYNNEWNYQVSRDAVSDARYADETAYARQQADLDRALQYYQAGYDPLTGGMSAEARQQYELGLRAQGIDPTTGNMTEEAMLKYLQANGTNYGVDAYVNSLNVSDSEKARLKDMYHSSNTGNGSYLSATESAANANQLIDDALTRSQFSDRVKKNNGSYTDHGKKYTKYEKYMEDLIDRRYNSGKISEDDAVKLYKYFGIY